MNHSFSELEIAEVSGRPVHLDSQPRPFDRDESFLRYARSMPDRVHIDYHQWDEPMWTQDWIDNPGILSRQEAHFWFVAGTMVERLQDSSTTFTTPSMLRRIRYNGELEIEQAVEMLRAWNHAFEAQYRSNRFYTQSYLARCLGVLHGTAATVETLLDALPLRWVSAFIPYVGAAPTTIDERAHLIDVIDTRLVQSQIEDVTDRSLLARLAPLAGHQEQCRRYLDFEIDLVRPPQPQLFPVLSAISDDDEFLRYFDKLHTPINRKSVVLFVSRFGEDACEYIHQRVTRSKDRVTTDLPNVLSHIHSPKIVPTLLHLYLDPATSLEAEAKLLEDDEVIITGLIESLQNLKFKPAAIELLRKHRELGHGASIDAAGANTSDSQQDAMQELVLEHVQIELPPLPEDAFPAWLKDIATPRKPKALPKFVSQKSVKPIFTSGLEHELPKSAIYGILEKLKTTTIDSSDQAFVAGLTDIAEFESLREFLWMLFSDWTRHGLQTQHMWCMEALGVFGDDEIAQRLAPYVDEWPAQKHHALAYRALEIFEAIGSDFTLSLLNRFSRESQFKGVKTRATQLIERMARKKNTDIIS